MEYFDVGMPWYAIATMAAFIAIMIHALLAALGRAFALNELERYAHSEMLQGAATFLMVVFVVGMISAADGFAVEYFIGPGQALPCGTEPATVEQLNDSLDLLKCRAEERGEVFADLQEDIIEASGWPLFRQSIYWAIFGFPIVQGAYFSDLYKEIETYRILLNVTTNMLIATNTLAVFTDYIKNNMLALFLPLGLLLRSFHFTRGIGAFFMATAIGFYFIFPIFYIISDPAYVKPAYDVPMPPPSASYACYPTFSGVVGQLVGGSGGGTGASANAITLDELRSDISSIYFSVVLHPFIIFSITLIIVRQMMYFLGGEAQDLLRMVSKVV